MILVCVPLLHSSDHSVLSPTICFSL